MTPEDRKALLGAIKRARLTRTKLAIIFMYAWGFTQEEIGEALELDRTTVNHHWKDATGRLRVLIPAA